jgi:hypothetical protein
MVKKIKKINGLELNINRSTQSNVIVLETNSNIISGTSGYTGLTINLSGVLLKGEPRFNVNGIIYKIGFDSTPSNNQVYFSPDGTIVRTSTSSILNGDKVYWNPLYANSFDLDATDSVGIDYLTQVI